MQETFPLSNLGLFLGPVPDVEGILFSAAASRRMALFAMAAGCPVVLQQCESPCMVAASLVLA